MDSIKILIALKDLENLTDDDFASRINKTNLVHFAIQVMVDYGLIGGDNE